MRFTFKTLLIAAVFCSATVSQAQVAILSKVMGNSKLSATEAAIAIVVADALGMKVDAFIKISNSKNEPCSVIGPALIISRQSGRSLDDVLKNKPKGEGWGNVAKRMGMHPGTFNKMRVKGDSFDRMLWLNLLGTKYKVSESAYNRCSKRGLNDIEIVLAFVKCGGKSTGLDKAIKEVISERKKDKNGDDQGNKNKGKGKGGKD